MQVERLTGLEKAAIILYFLGEDLASDIMKNLPEEDVHAVGRVMVTIRNVPADMVNAVVEEFYGLFGRDDEQGIYYGGEDFIAQVISKALGEEKAAEILESIQEPDEDVSGIEALERLEPRTISSFLRQEHPQTISLILAHLEPALSAQVVELLSEDQQADVVVRMAGLDQVPPGVLEDIGGVLQDEIRSLGNVRQRHLGGIKSVAEMVNRMNKSTETNVLGKLEDIDPDLAENIRQLMFTFDDLVAIDDQGIQLILREISNEVLTVALKTADIEMKDKLFRNMSERASMILQEDLEAMGPIRLSEVETAQRQVVAVARKLEEEGRLVITSGGEDVLV